MEFDRIAGDYERILDRSVAASGETSAYFADYKARYLARFAGPGFAGSVLDYGCGVGLLASALARRLPRARLEGFDVSRQSVERVAPALASRALFTWEADRLRRDYDLIVVANVMHHVDAADRQATIQSLAGRLAPRGRLVLFEHNPANPLTRRTVARCPFDAGVALLPPAEAARYLAGARLRLVRRDYIVFLPRFLSWLRPLEPRLAWLPLGAQYASVGERQAERQSDLDG